jgi:hypothetical protein
MQGNHPIFEVDPKVLSDARWALIERIASSHHLKSSVRLCEFLFYIADCAIREAPEEATEQQIGIRVFGRPPGYNSSEDSIVRTHARLLRQKLAAYFAEEGKTEPLQLELPKGHYRPVFHRVEAPAATALEYVSGAEHGKDGYTPPKAPLEPPTLSGRLLQRWHVALLAVAVLLIAGVTAFLWKPWLKAHAPSSPVETFWKPFLSDEPPIVIYSNALFTGDSTNGLRYATVQSMADLSSGSGNYVDTYTGIGELSSVYDLTKLFDSYHDSFILKRSLLVTWDEAQMKNLIFIGSRAENPSLRVLQATSEFSMMTEPGLAGFINHHPKPGEPQIYSRPEHPLAKDYAILALMPGVQPGKRMLVFSGLTTFGTQAAVEFVCRPDTAAQLLQKITTPKGEIRPFEALLETTIGGGVPLQTHLVTIRVF